MVVREIQHILESWAPKQLAWTRDNVGLQLGSPNQKVRKILVTLDVTPEVEHEAHRKRIDLIVSHHPLIFHPLSSIDGTTRKGRMILDLAQHRISVLSAHTNLDFTYQGVSAVLSELLSLEDVSVLLKRDDVYKKIIIFVPTDYAERIMVAMANAGAGQIGKYELCSFQAQGTGTFKAMKGAKPFTGKIGKAEKVSETRLEMIVPTWKLVQVLTAMRATHPYEEVAYDVYDLSNESPHYGAGAIGELRSEITLKKFLEYLKLRLGTPALRYTGNPKSKIKRVAVCGGSGSDLLPAAISQKADVFVTADCKYHTFQDAEGSISLVDAGHFETEQPVVAKLVNHLKKQVVARREDTQVFAARFSRSPVQYYLS